MTFLFIVSHKNVILHKITNHLCFLDDESSQAKAAPVKKSSENDLYMRLGLLLGDSAKRSKRAQESCSSLTSYDISTVLSANTSPVSTLTGSSEDQHRTNPSSDSVASLMSLSISGQSNCSSSPLSRRHSVTSKYIIEQFNVQFPFEVWNKS